jgi:hypothetical protein
VRITQAVLLVGLLTACTAQNKAKSEPDHSLTSGGVDGGGGNAVVCRDNANKITSAEVLDIYEGRVQYGVTPLPSLGTVEEQVHEVLTRLGKGNLPNSFAQMLHNGATWVLQKKVMLPDGTGLTIIDDSFPDVLPKDCKIEQLANWTPQDQVLVDTEIWNSLSDTNKAALVAHEILYYFYRIYGAEDSVRVRESVARAFAGAEAVDVKQDLPADHLLCFSEAEPGKTMPPNIFRAFNKADGMLVLQLEVLGGQLMITKSQVEIDVIPMEVLVQNSPSTVDLKNTYSLKLHSEYDYGLGLAVEINTSVPSGGDNKTLRIGLGNWPSAKMQSFVCAHE